MKSTENITGRNGLNIRHTAYMLTGMICLSANAAAYNHNPNTSTEDFAGVRNIITMTTNGRKIDCNTINPVVIDRKKKDYRSRYKKMAKSKWFKRAYEGISVDFISTEE